MRVPPVLGAAVGAGVAVTTTSIVFSTVFSTTFSTGFSSEEACRSYGQAYVSRPEARGVRTAECVGLRNGKVIDFTTYRPVVKKMS